MAIRYYPDGNGVTIRLFDDDGRMMLTSSARSNWHEVTKMTSRDDDVLICTYPKSGTHWVWEIVTMLMTGRTQVTSSDMKSQHLFFVNSNQADKMDSPRVFCTHRQFHDLPSDFIVNRRKLVLVTRDPKDICVSSYEFFTQLKDLEYEGTFDGFLTLFLQGKVLYNSWARWVLSFEKGLKEHPELSYHVVSYEQLKMDPVREILKLAEYLGKPSELAQRIAEQTEFKVMRQSKVKADDPYSCIFKDGQGHKHVFNKGQSGRWKEWFSEEQTQQFDAALREKLGRDSIVPLF